MMYPRYMTVLLAEDERTAREVATLVLEAEGYRVIATDDGTKALDILKKGTIVDLLLSDIHMVGGIDGIELAQRVQMSRRIRIVLTSVDARSSFAKFPVGVTFLPKPYDRQALLAAVAS